MFKKLKEKIMLKKIEPEVDNELIKMNLLTIDEKGIKDYKMGSINVKWDIQKKLLKEKFNYNWKSTQEKKPNINFD
jgi:hypothetical protein